MTEPPVKLVGLRDIADILKSIRVKLEKFVDEAYVIGSIVDGSAVEGESDLDLLIVPSKKVDWYSLLEKELFQLLDKGLSLHIHVADNPTYRKMVELARKTGIKLT